MKRPHYHIFRTGDILCPGVDVDEYKASCRVPLFPNQWNVWEVWVSTSSAKTPSQVIDLARNFMRHVFAGHSLTFGPQVTQGPSEYVTASIGAYGGFGADNQPKGARGQVVRREDLTCDVLPTVESGQAPMLVTIAFVFRGNETSWPWPTLGNRPASVFDATQTGWCPINAIAVLQRALIPVPGERVPEPGGIWQNIKDEFPDFAGNAEIAAVNITGAVKSLVSGATSRLAFFALGGAAALYLLNRFGRK